MSDANQLVVTRSQRFAQRAFKQVSARQAELSDNKTRREKYVSFAKSFPSLIHTCGLVQALTFVVAKKQIDVAADVAAVIGTSRDELLQNSRQAEVTQYIGLTQQAIEAAGWVKRYTEALFGDITEEQEGGDA